MRSFLNCLSVEVSTFLRSAQRLHRMSSSLAPECNEVKEYVYILDLGAGLSDVTLDATTHASSSGTVIVRNDRLLHSHPNSSVEYLRGESTTDECQSLFKHYKACLDVIFLVYRLDRRS